MTRRELRENVFKMLFRVEFFDAGELSEQLVLFGEEVDAYKDILKRIAGACCTDVFFACDQANRIAKFIDEAYGVKPDFPWKDDNGVFRHLDNNKWFSLIMYVSLDALLKDGNTRMVNIMNLKSEEHYDIDGIYPAYHMNHKSWISLVLDDTLSDSLIMELVSKSYNLTKKKRRK